MRNLVILALSCTFAVSCQKKVDVSLPSGPVVTPPKPSAPTQPLAPTATIDSQSIRYDFTANLGQSVLADFPNRGGLSCFEGTQVEETKLNQIIYRIQSTFDRQTRIHTTEATAVHVNFARHLKDIGLSERYRNLVGMTERKRSDICGNQVVDSIFAGHRMSYRFSYLLEPGEAIPEIFDITLGNSPDERNRINQVYAPLFAKVRTNRTDHTYLSQEPWLQLKLSEEVRKSPLDIMLAYMQRVEPLADDPKNRIFLPIVHISPAPRY